MPVVGSNPHLEESETLCNEGLLKAVRHLKAPTISALQGLGTSSSLKDWLLWKLWLAERASSEEALTTDTSP